MGKKRLRCPWRPQGAYAEKSLREGSQAFILSTFSASGFTTRVF
jgi:hypothetical protein